MEIEIVPVIEGNRDTGHNHLVLSRSASVPHTIS